MYTLDLQATIPTIPIHPSIHPPRFTASLLSPVYSPHSSGMLQGTNVATPLPSYEAGIVLPDLSQTYPDLAQPQLQPLALQVHHSSNTRFPDYKMQFPPPGICLLLSPCPASFYFSFETDPKCPLFYSHLGSSPTTKPKAELSSCLHPQLCTQPSSTKLLIQGLVLIDSFLKLSSLVDCIIHLYLQSIPECHEETLQEGYRIKYNHYADIISSR